MLLARLSSANYHNPSLITGRRVQVPPGGFEEDPKHPSTLTLDNGETLSTDLVILGTGQKPNNQIVKALPTTLPGGLINPQNGFVRVSPNLRIADESYPNIFAVGDIADTGSHKAARPGSVQAGIVARNILALINGQQPVEEYAATPPGIHLSLGLVSYEQKDGKDGLSDGPMYLDRREILTLNGLLTLRVMHTEAKCNFQKSKSFARNFGACCYG